MLVSNMFRGFAVAGILLVAASPALADAIDGKWCSEGSRRFAIAGPAGLWGAGVKITGDYDRHGYRFTMPTGEPDSGQPVDMALQGEYRVRVKIGTGEPEIWRRCPPEVS